MTVNKTIEVISNEDGDDFVCTGTNSRKVAYKEIKKYLKKECGLIESDFEDLSPESLELVPVWDGSTEEPDYTYWGTQPPGGKYSGSGWRYNP